VIIELNWKVAIFKGPHIFDLLRLYWAVVDMIVYSRGITFCLTLCYFNRTFLLYIVLFRQMYICRNKTIKFLCVSFSPQRENVVISISVDVHSFSKCCCVTGRRSHSMAQAVFVGLSMLRPEFDTGPVHVAFVVGKVTLCRGFLRIIRCFPRHSAPYTPIHASVTDAISC
jgi:hypothetical protein